MSIIQKKDTAGRLMLRTFLKNKTAVVCFIILAFVLCVSLLAPFIAPYDYDAISVSERLQSPSLQHLFGTDEYGRDIFSRILYGGKYSLAIGLGVVVFSNLVGFIIGAVSGYAGGAIENVIMRLLDIVNAVPSMLLAIVLASIMNPGFLTTIIAISIGNIPQSARLVRASIMSIRKTEYIEAAENINCSKFRVIIRHILPNISSPLIVSATMLLGRAILGAAGLSFIGCGIQAPLPEWGAMLSDSRNYMRDHAYMVIFPGLAIMIVVLAINLIGDALRDALDPKMRK